jgi:DnaJ-class molecular chaperone
VKSGDDDSDSAGDYYALLGVDAEADSAVLLHTWRQLAMRWHPDRAGPGATATFQKLLDAYTVLSDPVARAAYDWRRRAKARSPRESASSPPTATRSAPAVMLSRLCGTLNSLLACGVARRADDDVIELFLRAQEAGEGGMVTISMRVPLRCPKCAADEEVSCRPGVGDGTVLTPSALLPGMVRPVSFRVRLRPDTPKGI